MVSESRPPQVHPFWFSYIYNRNRGISFANPRDAFAAHQPIALLVRRGYEIGDSFMNFPKRPFWHRRARSEYTAFDESRLSAGDLILETTRFPLNDPPRTRKRVPRGFTTLEGRLYDFWTQFFQYVDRGNVALQPEVEDSLLPGCEAYVNMELQMNGGADVRFVDGAGYRGTPPLRGTVAFYLRTDQAWENGPGLFACFGMDAEASAVWSWILCHELRELTERRGFFMAALERPAERPSRGWYSDMVRDWKARLVLEHEFQQN